MLKIINDGNTFLSFAYMSHVYNDYTPEQASLVAQTVKNLPEMLETQISIPELGRSPRERKENPLQYSYLENSMDREA